MNDKDYERKVDDALDLLREHFDAVQILATWNETGLTKTCARGSGNWHARQGMAHDFINRDIAQENAREIAEHLEPPGDQGEVWKEEK